jgi:ribosomal protein S18 acetylase RimI-like enzyme
MTITVRRSRPDDHAAILALMDQARGDDLTPEERSRRGFVQGTLTPEILARFQDGPGIFVAEAEGEFAGFAITSLPGGLPPQHPAAAAVTAVTAVTAVEQEAGDRDPGRLFLYGPVAVAPRFQGRGILTRLLTALSRALQDDFDLAVAFVETTNERSLAVHRHYAMTEAAHFTTNSRTYAAFTFPPSLFV